MSLGKRCVAGAVLSLGCVNLWAADSSHVDDAVLQRGKALFLTEATPACAICHTLADAGAAGTIGPDLDELDPDIGRVKQALKDGVGAMPSFAETLSESDMDAVAAYVVHATGVRN